MEVPGFRLDPEQLKCMNCKTAPGSVEWGKVFVCQACADFAGRVFYRIQTQVNQLETLAFEAIRLSLIKGELHPGEYQEQVEVSKEDLLRSVVDLVKGKPNARSSAGDAHRRDEPGTITVAGEVVLELPSEGVEDAKAGPLHLLRDRTRRKPVALFCHWLRGGW